MKKERIDNIYILDKEIEAALRGSNRPVKKLSIPAGSKIKILSSSPEPFYEFAVVKCALKGINKGQVYVIARNDLDKWITKEIFLL